MPAHKKFKRNISGLRNQRRPEPAQNEEDAPSATALSEAVMRELNVQVDTAAVSMNEETTDQKAERTEELLEAEVDEETTGPVAEDLDTISMFATRAATRWTRKKTVANDQGMRVVSFIAVVLAVTRLQFKRTRTPLWPGPREQKPSNPTPIRA